MPSPLRHLSTTRQICEAVTGEFASKKKAVADGLGRSRTENERPVCRLKAVQPS